MNRKTIGVLIFAAMTTFAGANNDAGFFTDITAESGIDFVHDPAVEGEYFFPEVMGSGCAFLDFDNDGDLDIYLINGASRKKSNLLTNKLYRQESHGKFTDVTVTSGLGDSGYGMGVAVADINNDGYIDVYVSNFGPDALYKNNGDGTFSNISAAAGIHDSAWSTSVTFLDFDRDGYLDIFVTNYVAFDPSVRCTDRAGRQDYCGPEGYEGNPDILYHNQRDGTFRDVSLKSGIGKLAGKGLGVVSADFNQDGYPDLYVANDREPNFLWINQRNGTFKNMALPLGAAVNALGQSEASMGIAPGDVDHDLLPDLFITNLREETNTLYRNAGALGFQDDSFASGLGPPALPYTGFGDGFFDYDHDGDLDLAIVNGRVIRGTLLTKSQTYWDDYAEPNLLFENAGNGKFANITAKSGAFGQQVENSRGLAFGDVDGDGDLDLLISNCGQRARLLRNDAPKKGGWLTVRAFDPKRQRDDIGAIVIVVSGAKQMMRIIQPAYGYLSNSDVRAHFGLGNATADRIIVKWSDGTQETFAGVKGGQWITLEKGSSQKR